MRYVPNRINTEYVESSLGTVLQRYMPQAGVLEEIEDDKLVLERDLNMEQYVVFRENGPIALEKPFR